LTQYPRFWFDTITLPVGANAVKVVYPSGEFGMRVEFETHEAAFATAELLLALAEKTRNWHAAHLDSPSLPPEVDGNILLRPAE
jgi:hypothetical protein